MEIPDDLGIGPDGEIIGGDGTELTPSSKTPDTPDAPDDETPTFDGASMSKYHAKIVESCMKLTAIPSQWFVILKHNMVGEESDKADLSHAEIIHSILSHPDDDVRVMNGVIRALERAANELRELRDEKQRDEDND